MPFETHTCVAITCDNGCAWEDDDYYEGTPHFTSREEAIAHARRCGWLVGDRIVCRDCALKADCTATGHQWGGWWAYAHHGVRYRKRTCEHCNGDDYDPPWDELRAQLRAVDDAEQVIAEAATGGTDRG